jgi:acyl-CoA synthetase (AMP-forming)/AMP-acid ligase II
MSTRPKSWPTATGELLPTTLFKIANLYPDIVWVEYFSDSQDIAKGHRKVTYREFANAVHALAWWIEENVGKPTVGDGRETMVYIGPNDLRYGILVLASIVTGYTVSRDDVEL